MGSNPMAAGSRSLWLERKLGFTRLALAGPEGLLGPLLVLHTAQPWLSGLRTQGRVTHLDRRQGAAWLTLPELSREGFLNLRGLELEEGQGLAVEVASEPEETSKALALRLPDTARQADSDPLSRLQRALGWEGLPLQEIRPHETEALDLLDQAQTAASRTEIPLNPGSLTLDKTRAGWMADVNGPPELDTNLAAARALARSVLDANLSGLIVVDFLPLSDKASRRSVQQALTQALAQDPLQHEVGAMDHRGILALHRQRYGRSLIETLASPEAQALTELGRWQAALHAGARGPFTLACRPEHLAWLKPLAEQEAARWSVKLSWQALPTPAALLWSTA